VFENRALRRIFGLKRDGVMGRWRKLHKEELHDLYSSPNIIRIFKSRRMKWAAETREAFRLLVGKSEGKRQTSQTKTKLEKITLSWTF
jgi:hypothetical protein